MFTCYASSHSYATVTYGGLGGRVSQVVAVQAPPPHLMAVLVKTLSSLRLAGLKVTTQIFQAVQLSQQLSVTRLYRI